MSNQPPIEVPQGAIRLNTDSQKLEFFAQDRWYEIATENASGIGNRGFRVSGTGAGATLIETFNITSLGNSHDTGFDLSTSRGAFGCSASRTRAIIAGGNAPGVSNSNDIQYFEMAALSNTIDFGDLTTTMAESGAHSNNVRFVIAGAASNANNVINFLTVASTGSAQDFGDTLNNLSSVAACGSPTRAIWGTGIGGSSPYPALNLMEFVTIASTGNSVDFGDLTVARYSGSAGSNSTRALFFMGNAKTSPEAHSNVIDFVTIASTGDAVDFGDSNLIDTGGPTQGAGVAASPNRIVFFGGYRSGTDRTTEMQYVNPTTKGDSTRFGDLETAQNSDGNGLSSSHGGL